jgi:hypothetical protein
VSQGGATPTAIVPVATEAELLPKTPEL